MSPVTLGLFVPQASPLPSATQMRPSSPMQVTALSPFERLADELKEMIVELVQARPRDTVELSLASKAMRNFIGARALVHPLSQKASRIRCLAHVVEVLGTPSDDDGRGGSGILGLPKSLRAIPLRMLNSNLYAVDYGERDQAACLLAQATVDAGCDPDAINALTRADLPPSAESLAAIRLLWGPVNALPLSERTEPLRSMVDRIPELLSSERADRFSEHLAAWEELVRKTPDAVRGSESDTCPLDISLPECVPYLPVEAMAPALGRITAMRAVLAQSSSSRVAV